MKKLAFLVVLAVAGLGTAPAVARSAKAQDCFPRSETGKDYWLIVTLSDESQCPTYPGTTDRVQVGGMPGVGLFFRHL